MNRELLDVEAYKIEIMNTKNIEMKEKALIFELFNNKKCRIPTLNLLLCQNRSANILTNRFRKCYVLGINLKFIIFNKNMK